MEVSCFTGIEKSIKNRGENLRVVSDPNTRLSCVRQNVIRSETYSVSRVLVDGSRGSLMIMQLLSKDIQSKTSMSKRGSFGTPDVDRRQLLYVK